MTPRFEPGKRRSAPRAAAALRRPAASAVPTTPNARISQTSAPITPATAPSVFHPYTCPKAVPKPSLDCARRHEERKGRSHRSGWHEQDDERGEEPDDVGQPEAFRRRCGEDDDGLGQPRKPQCQHDAGHGDEELGSSVRSHEATNRGPNAHGDCGAEREARHEAREHEAR